MAMLEAAAAAAMLQTALISLTPSDFKVVMPGRMPVWETQIELPFAAKEVIPSWNAEMSHGGSLSVQVAAPGTPFYSMGVWGFTDQRSSVKDQKDEHGRVATDTIIFAKPTRQLTVRVKLFPGPADGVPDISRIYLNVSSSGTQQAASQKISHGMELPVPTRAQHDYPNGNVLCSPTTIAMLMHYWADVANRPELRREVPEIKEFVYDPAWEGTGNWPFNVAYPGSFGDLNAYVTRLRGVGDLEQLIAQRIPVSVSVSYPLLLGRERTRSADGHLVVVIGFTEEGDPIINDPAKRDKVRQVYARERLIEGWAASQNTSYIIHPEGWTMPATPGPWLNPRKS